VTGRGSLARRRLARFGLFILLVNALILAVFTWLSGVRRAESRALEVASRRATLEGVWAQVEARKSLVATNRKDIESLRRDHLKPRDLDLFAAQREIERLATEAGLKPKQSNYDVSSVEGTDLVRCEVTLPLDGSYANLTGFLSRVAASNRFLVVDQMSLSEDAEAARMSLKLSAVFTEGGSRATR
jgi:Tfp pilus assembly protein PilO